jgi:hypothetical protein
MKILLDEQLAVQLLDPLGRNRDHEFVHVDQLGWKGKKDKFLFPDAASKGFDAIVGLDVDQLADPDEWKSLRKSDLHHISVRQGRTVKGRKGLARVMASLIVAMPYVVEELAEADDQRIVEVTLLSSGVRHESFEARRERAGYPYWRGP